MCMNLFRQYYEWLGTEQANGNPTHSFAAEKALMQFLAHQKLVNWCHSEDVRGPTHPQTLATLTHTHTHTYRRSSMQRAAEAAQALHPASSTHTTLRRDGGVAPLL